jgi:septal ring factor EnvC (AmiA/AmiB activator)
MADYFESGPGKAILGDSSPTAVATCCRLEETLAQVAARTTFSGDLSKTRADVRQWAADHPIKYSIAGRESTLSRVLDREAAGALSTGEVVYEITTAVDDLSRRLDIYSDQMVRQARWEADLLKSEILADVPLDQALPLAERAVRTAEQAAATVDRLAPAVERALSVAENTPKLITSERKEAINALQVELARTIRFAQEERTAALAQLTQERIATLKDLDERLEIERKALTVDLDRISVQVVDHAIWRVAQLAAVILIALFISAVLLLLLTRRLFPVGQSPNGIRR